MVKVILKDIPDLNKLDVYVANEGFSALRKCLTGMSPDDVIEEVKNQISEAEAVHVSRPD